MHISAPGLQSVWHAQFSRASSVAASNAVSATPMVGAVATLDTGQSVVAAIHGGSLFHNLVVQLMQQQGLTAANIAGTSGAPASVAKRFGQSGLETNIRSLITALSASQNTTQTDQLSTTFKTLVSGLGDGGKGSTSAQNASLTLQTVLQGMLQNVQQRAAPAELGQFVDTFA
jgi:hypothetical protein